MINAVQKGMLYEIRFPYNTEIIEIVKSVPGRVWVPEKKCWTIPLARLGFLIASVRGTKFEPELLIQSAEELDVNQTLDSSKEVPDIDISDVDLYVEKGSMLFQHQLDAIKYDKWRWENGLRSGFILGDQPGCIDGKAEIQIKELGKPATRSTSIKNAYKLWSSGHYFQVKVMCDSRFVYRDISKIIYSGKKHCLKLSYGDHSIQCTPDHEIYTVNGWKRADELNVGDEVMCNGQYVCKLCGSSKDVVTSVTAKFSGYCRKCIYTRLRNCYPNYWKSDIVKRIDEWGYVRLFGPGTYDMPNYHSVNGMGIYEHHQVWYEHTGHVVDTSKEVVHHINHIRTDNRFENLQLMTITEHALLHSDVSKQRLPQYNVNMSQVHFPNRSSIWLVTHPVAITGIEEVKEAIDTYDITIDDPDIHNFVANNLVVHNCGKTLSVINIAMYHRKKYGSKHCLVICCVNSAKYNWRDDILKHSNEAITPYILGTRMKRDGSLRYDGSGKEKFKDFQTMKVFGKEDGSTLPYFLILNIEAIGRTKIGKTHVITQAIIDLIQKGEIGVIAVDEIHLNCLEYNTLIRTDQGLKKIGDIVENKSKLNVLSYDTDSNKYVYKPIEDWHSVAVDTQLLELVIEEEGCRKTIQCTPNHLFYTRNRGWVSAANLSELDDIILNKEYIHDN